jgi:bacterioferritin (cytochrome b1)
LTVIISQEEEHVRDLESVLKKINTNMWIKAFN